MKFTDIEKDEIQNLLYGYDCEYIPQLKEATDKIFNYLQEKVSPFEVCVMPEIAVVKPACGHKLTAKQFFIKQYQEGKCEDITTNPEPEFNNNFYLNIYKLMEDYSKSV